jgi:hypothetical protein
MAHYHDNGALSRLGMPRSNAAEQGGAFGINDLRCANVDASRVTDVIWYNQLARTQHLAVNGTLTALEE